MDIENLYEKTRAITAVSVGGFKSLAEEQRVEIRPLTLLAGANSSGKSSLLQPILLLKQTLEDSSDPGPLLLDGPHVRYSNADQVLTRIGKRRRPDHFRVGFESGNNSIFEIFQKKGEGFDLMESSLKISGEEVVLKAESKGLATEAVEALSPAFFGTMEHLYKSRVQWDVVRFRCFLSIMARIDGQRQDWTEPTPDRVFGSLLRRIIHIPGLRGNPERFYKKSAVGESFPGSFDRYVASIVATWQSTSDERFATLNDSLRTLGLTWNVAANSLDANRLELLVGQLSNRDGKSFVNIADVGMGVSQSLPVLVALLVAEPGSLVFIEQPEFHLHPRAEQAMASILADAVNRGVRVVAETHSSILLLAVQTLIAQDKLDPANVILHWFQRDKRGATKITTAELDEHGAYGDWPVDFGEVEMAADNAYLDAVEAKVFPEKMKRARK
ncbi:MAG TPA: AAA family ATPase [Thermoanaerobaculia bacterium]